MRIILDNTKFGQPGYDCDQKEPEIWLGGVKSYVQKRLEFSGGLGSAGNFPWILDGNIAFAVFFHYNMIANEEECIDGLIEVLFGENYWCPFNVVG